MDRDAGVAVPVDDIEKGIRDAAACFVDVTVDNPNVWFELGYAIAAKKDLCLVCSKERTGAFPFDIQHRKVIRYSPEAPRDFVELGTEITKRLEAILNQQDDRVTIQALAKETTTAGLADFEAAALSSIGSVAVGVDDSVSNSILRDEMEKAGFNHLASNVAVRGLRTKELIQVIAVEDYNGNSYEAYVMTERGWEWITANIHMLNLSARSKPRDFGGNFNKELDDEIPF